MKANELMIGDWVYIPPIVTKRRDYTTKVVGVGEEFILFRKESGIDNIELGRVQPIVLTPEIIEKNGFAKEYNKWRKVQSDELPYEIQLEDEGHFLYLDIRTYNNDIQSKIIYVHELQHALRLIGLNELADNFKI